MGAKINNKVLALPGKIVSFTNNFKPSAKGCNKPKIPTKLGPLRLCIEDNIFLSAKVKYATAIKIGKINKRIFNVKFIIKKNKYI